MPTSISLSRLLLALCLSFSSYEIGDVNADDRGSKSGESNKSNATDKDRSVEKKVDLYAVPDGDVQELLKFLDRIQSFRPTKVAEFLEQRQKKSGAIKKAAEKILEIEEDPASKAATTAVGILLGLKIERLDDASPEKQETTFEEIHRHLVGLDKLTSDDLVLALKTASTVKRTGNAKLAAKAYDTFGNMFVNLSDEALAGYGQEMLAVARQMNLLGNEMEITGTTLDGDTFDWTAYRGKVVLVDFWATWCGPCVAELPHVRRHYDEYHERGFDVVGISLDRDRERLAKFVEERELPWVTLFEPGADGDHPVAGYYGVRAIPTAILVNQAGKVVSLRARGPELGHQLAQLLGPSSGTSKDE